MTLTHPGRCPPDLAASLVTTIIGYLRREYPNQIAHAMQSDADAGTPRSLHPAFFGSYDWHSAVHGHWALVRLLRVAGEGAPWAGDAQRTLSESLTPENLRAEAAYLLAEGRAGFERPYGLAWVLQLDAELREWASGPARARLGACAPLTDVCAERLLSWISVLTHPVRTGVHSQSAFAMALALDWAVVASRADAADLLRDRARALHGGDAGWSLAFEPSGEDFLSPSLAEADLMRRVMGPAEFAAWLTAFLPELAGPESHTLLRPIRPLDPSDGRLAHLDGLSLSRAWMLEGIASALPEADARIATLRTIAARHLEAGTASARAEDYARAHWLATFATYALTGRALAGSTPRASAGTRR